MEQMALKGLLSEVRMALGRGLLAITFTLTIHVTFYDYSITTTPGHDIKCKSTTLVSRQNGAHFADDIFKYISWIKISLIFSKWSN